MSDTSIIDQAAEALQKRTTRRRFLRDSAVTAFVAGVATACKPETKTATAAQAPAAGQTGGTMGAHDTAAGAATTAAAGSAADSSSGEGGPNGYLMDSLFRSAKGSKSPATPEQSTAEVTRIFANAAGTGKLPEEYARYAAQLVSQRAGISQQEAEKRVNETFNQIQAKKQQAKEAADKARKASAGAAILLFISLLIGAFIASYSATLGGRQRDD